MTPNESPALRTNDEPQRILLEASERIQACYPNGTWVEALIDGERVTGTVRYVGLRTRGMYVNPELFVIDLGDGLEPYSFSPAVHPHRVLP